MLFVEELKMMQCELMVNYVNANRENIEHVSSNYGPFYKTLGFLILAALFN